MFKSIKDYFFKKKKMMHNNNNSNNILHNLNTANFNAISNLNNTSTINKKWDYSSMNKLPDYKIFLYKAENEGFVMELRLGDDIDLNNFSCKPSKIFILKEIENLGRDIQNILMLELIKQ